jgi:hypothetical protein
VTTIKALHDAVPLICTADGAEYGKLGRPEVVSIDVLRWRPLPLVLEPPDASHLENVVCWSDPHHR